MKTVKTIITLFILSVLATSCINDDNVIEIGLDDLIPNSSGEYCISRNPSSSYDTFLWETPYREDRRTINILSAPIIFNDKIILASSSREDLIFKIYNRHSGELIMDKLTDLSQGYVDDIRIHKNLILVMSGRKLRAINAEDFTNIWEIEYSGYGPNENRYVITNNDKIIIPSILNSNGSYSIELKSIDVFTGSTLSTKSIYTENMLQSRGFNFVSLNHQEEDNKLLIGYKGWFSSENSFVELLNYNLLESKIDWKWNEIDDDIRPTSIKPTSTLVTIVSDSLYFINYHDGKKAYSQSINYPNYGLLHSPLIRIQNEVVYIKINSIGVMAISLSDFQTVWSNFEYDLITSLDVRINDNTHINTKGALRKVNLKQATEEVWEEMPYRCSYIDENYALDIEQSILYFTDSKRLYAMELD